jgi:hypothetical protein
LTGDFLHFLQGFLEDSPVLHGLVQGLELLRAEGDGNGLAGDLASPLVAGSGRVQGGTIQDRTLADVADPNAYRKDPA